MTPNAPAPVVDASLHAPGLHVTVEAPARLHLGFMDPAGTLGRPFGSLGLTVDGLSIRVTLGAADRQGASRAPAVPAAELDRALAHLHTLQQRTGRDAPLHLHLHTHLPSHAGLGSGTQLALAVGRAFACWHGLDLPTALLAQWLARGRRSGVGIAGFDLGGLLLDGGPLASGAPAPLLARVVLPAAWRVLLVTDPGCRGLSGAAELAALASLPPLGQAKAAQICHETLMRVLPGAAGAGFACAAAGLSAVQTVLGDHFAPAQQGEPYTSPAVGRLMRWLADAAQQPADGLAADALGAGIGQSSWGPTGFALLPSAARAQALIDAACAAGVVADGLQWRIATPLGHGARITTAHRLPADAAPSLHSSDPQA